MGSDPLLTVVEAKKVWVLASIAVRKGSDPIKSTRGQCDQPGRWLCGPDSRERNGEGQGAGINANTPAGRDSDEGICERWRRKSALHDCSTYSEPTVRRCSSGVTTDSASLAVAGQFGLPLAAGQVIILLSRVCTLTVIRMIACLCHIVEFVVDGV